MRRSIPEKKRRSRWRDTRVMAVVAQNAQNSDYKAVEHASNGEERKSRVSLSQKDTSRARGSTGGCGSGDALTLDREQSLFPRRRSRKIITFVSVIFTDYRWQDSCDKNEWWFDKPFVLPCPRAGRSPYRRQQRLTNSSSPRYSLVRMFISLSTSLANSANGIFLPAMTLNDFQLYQHKRWTRRSLRWRARLLNKNWEWQCTRFFF